MDAPLSQQPTLQSSDLQPSTLPASTLDSSNPDDIPIPGMGDNPPPPADEPSPAPEIFVAAVALNLTTDRYILGDGDEATLTVTVQRNLAESVAGITLTLVMPPELRTNGDLTWTLPELAEEEIFSRTVQVGVAQSNGQAVYEILAQVSSPGSKDAVTSVPLILRTQAAGAPNRPQEATAAVTVDGQETSGVMLASPRGDVAVMAPAGVFEIGSEVRYTDLYRRTTKEDPGVDPTPTPEATSAPTATPVPTPTEQPQTGRENRFYLPLLAAEGTESRLAALDLDAAPVLDGVNPSPEKVEPPIVDDEARSLRPEFGSNQQVYFYRVWQLDVTAPKGLANAQTEDKSPTRFEEPVTLLIQIGDLLDQGMELASLNLWTREETQADEDWQTVRTLYDAPSRTLIAQVQHFSQWGLGNGMTSSGNVLPSTKTFSSDRFTGNASVGYPIEVPTGLGGMAPSLSLNYSSSSADDLTLYPNGTYDYKSQAGWAGLGWNLGGLSFISRDPEKSLSSTYDVYQMVLNGTSVEIWYNETNGAYDTNPASFMKIERQGHTAPLGDWDVRNDSWIVTTGDGTKYTFGGPDGNMQNFESYYNGGWRHRRAVNRWYLREVRDILGNRMNFNYTRETRLLGGNCLTGGWWPNEQRWYDRSYYPTEIYWSGNDGAGVPMRMRVRFETESRDDWKIDGSINSCDAALYTNNRLKRIWVEVNDVQVGGWHALRKVELGYSYSAPVNNGRWPQAQHSLLNTIQQYGKNGGSWLNTQTFTYAGTHNDIRLSTADNGQGGVVHYVYHGNEEPQVCGGDGCISYYNHSYRHPLYQMNVYDGLGSVQTTTYVYSGAKAHVVDNNIYWASQDGFKGYEYLGHAYVKATMYEKVAIGQNSMQTIVQQDEQWFHQSVVSGNTQVVDPRRGRSYQHKTWNTVNYTKYVDDYTFWTALKKTGTTWAATTSFNTTDIYWVRQDAKKVWSDNGSNEQYLYYETTDQNGGQYGNVTKNEERAYSNDLGNYANKGPLLRTTRTQYYPNGSAHIVNKPARVTVKDANGLCVADTHFVYDYQAGYQTHYITVPILGLLSRVEQINVRATNGDCRDDIGGVDPIGWGDAVLVSETTYDTVGNVVSQDILDGITDAITTTYDSKYRLFPMERKSLASGDLKEQARYYGVGTGADSGLWLSDGRAFWGQMQGFCMVDGSTTFGCTTQSYDAFGRPVRRWELQPNFNLGSDASAATAYFYVNRGGSTTANFYIEWHAPRCEGNFTRQAYNGLGQLVQSQGPAQDWTVSVDGCNLGNAGSEVIVDYEYNALGQQSRQSVPRTVLQYVPGDNMYRTPNWGLGQTSTTYDGLGRPQNSWAPNGNRTQYYYGSRSTGVVMRDTVDTSQVRFLNWQQQDDLGRLAKTVNYTWNGTTWVTDSEVQLSYNGADNLIKTERRNGNSGAWTQLSSLTYDMLGRKKAMSDADLGTWSYTYDKRNNLLSQTDARNKTTCMAYDTMGRLDKKYTGSVGDCNWDIIDLYMYSDSTHYTYNGKSQLTQVTGPSASRSYAYNGKGQVEAETVTIDSISKTATTYYDAYNRAYATKYPDGEIVKVNFNSLGLPKLLCSSYLHSSGSYWCTGDPWYVSDASYDEAGRLTAMKYPAGGNLWRTQTYYPWTTSRSGGLLNQIKVGTTNGGTDRLYRQYTYNSFGDVLNDGSGVSNFTYDSLDRLTSAYSQNFTYDQAGRITNFASKSYTYASTPYHAVDKVNSADRYDYDANGNMTVRNKGLGTQQQTLVWNDANRLSQVKNNSGAVIESYTYDVDGNRIKEVAGTKTTRTFFPFYVEEKVGSTTTPIKYYSFNGQTIAMRRGGVLTYLHSDHLSSNTLVTNANGTVHSSQNYCAYGGKRTATWYGSECDPTTPNALPTDRTFTGQEQDTTGLMFYHARFYDPALGTFISPDTVVPEPGVVVDYNRYLYTRGNPLKYTDADGHSTLCSSALGIPGGVGVIAALLCQAGEAAVAYGPTLVQQAALWADKVPALADLLFNNPNSSQQAQQASSNAGNTGDPGGLDPNDPLFRRLIRQTGESDPIMAIAKASVEGPAKGGARNGVTVLGRYPAYVNMANKEGANYLNFVDDTWDRLTDVQRWAVNRQFLDNAIARGDTFKLASRLKEAEPGTYLRRELDYLFSLGYEVVDDILVKTK
ncbi:MAG: RHS repeat-associated core domain-containing protein [Caldilineaceae bacterium]|nr:RHS repeat-associated core domain-containing protein [Caldilineaceae bacterium]MBP8121595.1 RHS repeat-associated core domain-containing protein [Caldilineaceae bacterium]